MFLSSLTGTDRFEESGLTIPVYPIACSKFSIPYCLQQVQLTEEVAQQIKVVMVIPSHWFIIGAVEPHMKDHPHKRPSPFYDN